MIVAELECENCTQKLVIKEQKLFFPEEKSIEDAFCLECEEKVFEGITDGWFTVETVAKKRTDDKDCKFPMP